MPRLPKASNSSVHVSFWWTRSERRTSAKRTACSSCGESRQPTWCGVGLASSSIAIAPDCTSRAELPRLSFTVGAPPPSAPGILADEILAAKRMIVAAKTSETKRSTVCPSTDVCSKLTPAAPLAHTMICILSYQRLQIEPTCTPSRIAYVPCSIVLATSSGVLGASSSRQRTNSAESTMSRLAALSASRLSCARSACHVGRSSDVRTPTDSASCCESPAGPPPEVAARASSRMSCRLAHSRSSETQRLPSPQSTSK